MNEWLGEHPYYLVIRVAEGATVIDLDEYQWMTNHADLLRRAGTWQLMYKEVHRPLFTVVVNEGDQPYYTARHVGVAGGAGGNETIAYGIGKKGYNGEMTRLWILHEAGIICGGDDVDDLAVKLIHAKGPR